MIKKCMWLRRFTPSNNILYVVIFLLVSYTIYNHLAYKIDILNMNDKDLRILKAVQYIYNNKNLKTVYAITPTYKRYLQKAEMTRIAQTLSLVPNVHWIVVEDSETKTPLVTNLLKNSLVQRYTHLNAVTPKEHLKKLTQSYHKGIAQRNAGLDWLRRNKNKKTDEGVVYFMDDDNTYDIRLFNEIAKVKKLGIWPVGLCAGMTAEQPVVDKKTGKVVSFITGYRPDREFAIDMAGFGIGLYVILNDSSINFSYNMTRGLIEPEFLQLIGTKKDLEPLADNCTKVYVWHTKTVKPVIKKEIPNLEV